MTNTKPRRALPQAPRRWPLLIVVVGLLLGFGVTVLTPMWRLGCILMGSALTIGAIERMVLDNREAGLLQVRGRVFDVLIMLGTGAGIIALAILVPQSRPH